MADCFDDVNINFEPLTQKRKDIYNLVTSGGALVNPLQTEITNGQTLVNQAKSDITGLIGSPPSGWTDPDLTNVTDALTDLDTKINEFTTHTNRLSGKSFETDTGTNPDLMALVGVSSGIQNLELGLENPLSSQNQPVIDIFGSLFNSDSVLADIKSKSNILFTQISNNLITPVNALSQITGQESSLNTFINTDVSNYNTALTKLRRFSLASTLDISKNTHSCLITDKIASQALNDIKSS